MWLGSVRKERRRQVWAPPSRQAPVPRSTGGRKQNGGPSPLSLRPGGQAGPEEPGPRVLDQGALHPVEEEPGGKDAAPGATVRTQRT